MNTYSDAAMKTFQYIMSINKFREAIPEDHRPSWVKISTITVISTRSKNSKIVDYVKLRDIFTSLGSIKLKMINSKKTDGFEWQLKSSATFMNQITLWYKDSYSTKSIKVFSNGSLQMAGCSDIVDCSRVINQLNHLLIDLEVIDEPIPLTDYRIVMINTNFSLNCDVNVLKIIEHFSKSSIFNVTFEPDKYSAVKIKFKPAQDMKEVTVSIFGTGKVIITGAETLQEIALAYNTIIQQVNTHKADIKVSSNVSECKIFMGYKFDDLIPALKKLGIEPWTFARINQPIVF
jgi:TATA-box binding protein (TBP) (component of TFIID and TFIIIB)